MAACTKSDLSSDSEIDLIPPILNIESQTINVGENFFYSINESQEISDLRLGENYTIILNENDSSGVTYDVEMKIFRGTSLSEGLYLIRGVIIDNNNNNNRKLEWSFTLKVVPPMKSGLEVICSDVGTKENVLPGSGTADDPFVLCLSAHFSLIGDTETNTAYTLSAHYVMGQDIDLNNNNFAPIVGSFTGTFDGRGQKIMNLTISTNNHAALFLELGSEGTIKNLGIEEFSIAGSGRVGTLVATSSGTITNGYATGERSDLFGGTADDFIGGLVGVQESGSITSSYATGHAQGETGDDRVGGLVGYQRGDSHITSSYATGHARGETGDDRVGGLVGHQEGDSHITSSYATGNVNGGARADYVGGLVGHQEGDSHITSSYATGNVNGGENSIDVAGGLVGVQDRNSKSRITSSYATGNVNGGGGRDIVGSLVGESQLITSSYGFGTSIGEFRNREGTPFPSGVTLASDLTQANSSTTDANRWSTDIWDFGTDFQAPTLKYVDNTRYGDHDNDDQTAEIYIYTCTSTAAFLPSIHIDCGTTLLPGQSDE